MASWCQAVAFPGRFSVDDDRRAARSFVLAALRALHLAPLLTSPGWLGPGKGRRCPDHTACASGCPVGHALSSS